MAEFLLSAPPLLLLALAGLESARWLQVRQMIDLALWQAARAGATQHAAPAAMAHAFEQALLPLHARDTPQASAAWLTRTLERRTAQLSQPHGTAPPWQIRILQPDASAYARFADPALAIARTSGHAAINHDYQYEQHQRQQRQHPSRSPAQQASITVPEQDQTSAGVSNIFQANTLVLQLIYPLEPLVPGLGRLIASLSGTRSPYAQLAMDAGLLPIFSEVRISMESHPVQWPSLADGRVIQSDDIRHPASPRPGTACTGLWCQWRPLPAPGTGSDETPVVPGSPSHPGTPTQPVPPDQPGFPDIGDGGTGETPSDQGPICFP